jgi:RNA polymerase sigma-70 factor (ECF subfamily)
MPLDEQNSRVPPRLPESEERNKRLSELCIRYWDKLVAYAFRGLSPERPDRKDLAKEIVDRSLLKVVERGPSESVTTLGAYWRKTIDHELVNEFRHDGVRNRAAPVLTQKLQDTHPSPDSEYMADEMLAAVAQAMESLPPRCRLAFRLKEWEDKSTREIADVLASEGVEVTPRQVARYIDHARGVVLQALAAYEQRKE